MCPRAPDAATGCDAQAMCPRAPDAATGCTEAADEPNIDPHQVATSKRRPKVAKPKEYVDGAIARAQVSTARVLAQARAATS